MFIHDIIPQKKKMKQTKKSQPNILRSFCVAKSQRKIGKIEKNKQKLTAFILTFLLIFQTIIGVFTPMDVSLTPPFVSYQETNAAWYSEGGTWQYRKAITIDNTKVPNTDQTNFPVLISHTDADLKYTTSGGKVTDLEGDDIIFTSADGSTKLDHEIEKYASTTGEIIAWVKVPSLSSSVDTVLYVYYGNSSITISQEDIPGVWDDGGDNNFKMVQHLQETDIDGGAGDIYDSTGNNNDGTTSGMDTDDQVSGQVDGSFDFDGGDDYVIINSINGDNSSEGTYAFWLYYENSRDYDGFLTSGSANPIIYFRAEGTIRVSIDDTGGFPYAINITGGQVPLNQWVFYVITYDSSGGILYKNGDVDGQDTIGSESYVATSNFYIASNRGIADRYADSIIDEVRISSTARSADWITTEYNNQSDPDNFYELGIEELSNTATAPTATQATDGTGYVTIQTIIDNANDDDTLKFKIEYSLDDGSTWTDGDPYLTSFITTSPDQATEPDVTNAQEYQVGMPTNNIITSAGANTVTIKWDTKSVLNGTGAIGTSTPVTTVKLRIIPYDGTATGTPVVSASAFTVDNTAPSGGSIQINSNATYTTSSNTTLTLSATSANEMKFSNNNSDYSVYEPYGVSKEWDITNATYGGTSTDGAKTVYVIYKDSLGNEATVVNDSITYDSTLPTITNITSDKANGSYTTAEVIDIDLTFSEAVTSTGDVTVTLETGDTDRTPLLPLT